jgi:hypothetical protein
LLFRAQNGTVDRFSNRRLSVEISVKISRSQIACLDSGSGFILRESAKELNYSRKPGSGFFLLDPLGTFQKLRFEDLGVFVRIVIFLFLLTILFCYLFLDPPGGMSIQKNSFTLYEPERYGAGSGIRTHEGVTPNGYHVDVYSYRDLEAVALTTQPSRRNIGQRLNES